MSDYLGYQHVIAGEIPSQSLVSNSTVGARVVMDADFTVDGDIPPIVTPTVPVKSVINYLDFFEDYYFRIWVSPEEIRLSNPKIGFEYEFNVWNAFDRPNSATNYAPVDLDGIEFVEEDDLPITFKAIEFKTLHFIVTSSAPAVVEGRFSLEFTLGEGGFDLFVLLLGVLRVLPNEPMTEVWAWYTAIETSRNGTEQRQAFRDMPRTQIAYEVRILDEEDRRWAYQELYRFASRSVLVPMFQYLTPLNASASTGDTRIYFDIERSDIREGEYIIFYYDDISGYVLMEVETLHADGVTLSNPLTFDVDAEFWEVLPGRSMRLPNRSAFEMGAVDGGATMKSESTSWRTLLRPGSAVTLPSYEGIPVLPYKPIAVVNIDETFASDVEVIDNDSAQPIQRSTFTNPFVESSKQYQIDRETEMDWWRTFFNHTCGMLRPFLLPTWRDDLPLVETPTLGDNEIITSNMDFIDYWPYEAYKWVQIQSKAGVIYRRVEEVEEIEEGLRLALDDNIGVVAGSNEDMIVSFLNLTRLNSDTVTLDHFVNWTIVSIETRTVNQ